MAEQSLQAAQGRLRKLTDGLRVEHSKTCRGKRYKTQACYCGTDDINMDLEELLVAALKELELLWAEARRVLGREG